MENAFAYIGFIIIFIAIFIYFPRITLVVVSIGFLEHLNFINSTNEGLATVLVFVMGIIGFVFDYRGIRRHLIS